MIHRSCGWFLVLCVLFTAAAGVFGSSETVGPARPAQPVPTPIPDQEKMAKAEYRKLLDLQAALKKIPRERYDREPAKSFFRANEKLITYSEPAAEFYVRSELFWELRTQYAALPIAEEIAWTAAQNPLPGECEGYVNCILYVVNSTDAKYLKFYPNGKYGDRALKQVIETLAAMADPEDRTNYTFPTDELDRAELKKLLADLTSVLSAVSHPEGPRALLQVRKIGDAFK
ncbi:MAG: hypothetical protein AB7Q37_02285 [Pyrinomonadaceae bacterium]